MKSQFTIPESEVSAKAAERAEQIRKANEEMLKRTPLELRLQAVYIPLMITDCAIMLMKAVRDILVASCKAKAAHYMPNENDKILKKANRGIKLMIDEYEHRLRFDLGELRETVTEHSADMFDMLQGDFSTYRYSFCTAIRKAGVNIEENAVDLMAFCHLVKSINEYKIDYENKLAEKIRKCLEGTNIQFQVANNVYQLQINRFIDDILRCFGVPVTLDDAQLQLCRRILDNKVRTIQFVDEAESEE